jgi:vacuolar-type H+-ATPase subunit I/STV1
VDWRISLPILDKPKKSAEGRLRDAFERLKLGVPEVLPKGSRVSQNNVAKESGSDPSALRKSRYPLLIMDIQEYVDANKDGELVSERQKSVKRKRKNRELKEVIVDLKQQRDKAVDRIIYANLRILELSQTVDDLRARLEVLQPTAQVLRLLNNID